MPYAGQPKDTPIPPNLDRWNWGAFLLNWIWGIGNSTYIALLMFVPVVNIVMIFVLGAKGSKWAWKNRFWVDEAHFVKSQRNWARAGVAAWIAIPFLAGSLIFGIISLMKGSDAYKISMAKVRASAMVVEAVGEPIESGWMVTGNINLNGSSGRANLSIPISGPKCTGKVFSQAVKTADVWDVFLLVVQLDCRATPIVLINKKNIRIPNSDLGA